MTPGELTISEAQRRQPWDEECPRLKPHGVSQPVRNWDSDGTAGISFALPCGRTVFVSRMIDRGEPSNVNAEDWSAARTLRRRAILGIIFGVPDPVAHPSPPTTSGG